MEDRILGIHHITAIAGNPQRNYDFYTKTLGIRFVKKTVNFDDPGTYHFYYGNENGASGTILTFFSWTNVKKGLNGIGMATEIGYSIPGSSIEFWKKRFDERSVEHSKIVERFGEIVLPFRDPDGLELKLIVPNQADNRIAWNTNEIIKENAAKGFHSITLRVRNIDPTATVLTDIFGYHLLKQEGSYYRFITDAVEGANIVDVIEDPVGKPGINAGGTNHHVAFRVRDDKVLMKFREKVIAQGLQITEKIDRNYFFSLYFREPGGVLFEIASDNPGFTADEELSELGTHLKLPAQYESYRSAIEVSLPTLVQ